MQTFGRKIQERSQYEIVNHPARELKIVKRTAMAHEPVAKLVSSGVEKHLVYPNGACDRQVDI